MLENINIQEIWTNIAQWCGSYFWAPNTYYQGIIILGALIGGFLLYNAIKGKIRRKVESTNMPGPLQVIANNLIKLLMPILTLVLLFIGTMVLSSVNTDTRTELAEGVMKVLLAWIVIRTFAQFIGNAAVRNVFAVVTWTIAALSIFGILEQTTNTLNGIGLVVGDTKITLLAVINSILLIFALLYLAIFGANFAERRIKSVQSLTSSSQVLISKIIKVFLIVCALLIGVTSAGIDLSLFAVFGGAIGLGIGFGLQKGISNLFSGMLLLIDRSIKPGDVIELPDIGTFGWVNNMAARYTEIITRDNKSFLIPNEDFITQRVVNWSHGNSLIRIQTSFGIHYNSDPHKVKEIAEKAAAAAHDRVVSDPAPVCWLVEFGDSSLNFSLRFWIKDAEAGVTNIKGHVMMALWDAFKENGIEIPYPHREVFMHEIKA